MAKSAKLSSGKKLLQKEIAYQLENSLGKLKDLLGEKKFSSRVNKTAKLLTKGIKKSQIKPKADPVKAIPVKKNAAADKVGSKIIAEKSQAKAADRKKAAVKQRVGSDPDKNNVS